MTQLYSDTYNQLNGVFYKSMYSFLNYEKYIHLCSNFVTTLNN